MSGLLAYVASAPDGLIADTATLEALLASCWTQFEGSHAEGMAGYKLQGRLEKYRVSPSASRHCNLQSCEENLAMHYYEPTVSGVGSSLPYRPLFYRSALCIARPGWVPTSPHPGS